MAPADCWNWGKWGLKEYTWNGSFPWLVRWARRALAALVGPVQNISFLNRTLFHFICLHRPASWAVGRQSCSVACLLIFVYGTYCTMGVLFHHMYSTFSRSCMEPETIYLFLYVTATLKQNVLHVLMFAANSPFLWMTFLRTTVHIIMDT